jgi:hypothetical protein
MSWFTFYWRTGQRDCFEGETPEQALTLAGFSQGAVGALDFHARGDNKEYTWDKEKREWMKKPE